MVALDIVNAEITMLYSAHLKILFVRGVIYGSVQ